MRLGILFPFLLLYIIGIICAALTSYLFPLLFLILFFMSGLFLALFFKHEKIAGVFLLTIFFLMGWYLAAEKLNYQSSFIPYVEQKVEMQGMISKTSLYRNRVVYTISNPVINPDNKSFVTANKKEKIQLTAYEPAQVYAYGSVVKAEGILRIPSASRNPGDFDYLKYLQRRDIYTILNINEKEIVYLGRKLGNPLSSVAEFLRGQITTLTHPLNSEQKGIFNAIILGDKSGLTPENRAIFQGLGIMHIFAVSGLHVGFVMFLLAAITSLMKLPNALRNIIIFSCLALYAALTGFASPVLRAIIMLGIYWWGKEKWSTANTANALFVAAFVLLLFNPLLIFDASFQFTFSATAFIIFLTPIIKKIKYLGNDAIAVPTAAWMGTIPLTAYYFNIFTPLGIILALPAGLMAGVTVIIGFIAFGLSFFSEVIAQLLMTAVGGVIFYSEKLMLLFHKLPLIGEGLAIATPSLFSIFLYYFLAVSICVIYYYRYNPHLRIFIMKKYKPIIVVTLILIIFALSLQAFLPSYLEVVFLDVGQGDCVFIKTPAGQVIIIDGGGVSGTNNYGDMVLIPFLKHIGIKEVDLLINTHPHLDHIAGLYPVLEKYPVGIVLIPSGFEEDYQNFKRIMEEKNINYIYSEKGQVIELGEDIRLNILHPPADYPVSFGANNHSIVAELTYNDLSMLFTGDIEAEAINEMLAYTPSSQVLKFPHHGSSGSLNPLFLEVVNPQIAVIQVGRKNPFGHPGQDVLEYFADEGIPVYRNDLHGAISIYSKGQKIDKMETIIK